MFSGRVTEKPSPGTAIDVNHFCDRLNVTVAAGEFVTFADSFLLRG